MVLPAAAFAEKEGTFTNCERRVQRIHQAIAPPGMARGDWQILGELAARMGARSRKIAEEKYDAHQVSARMLEEMGIA